MEKVDTLKNLKPFKPGQSGNPAGRPKGSKSITSHLRELLQRNIDMGKTKLTPNGANVTAGQGVAISLICGALDGDTAKIKELIDRIDGTSKQVLEIENTEKFDANDVYSDIRKRLSNARKGPKTPKPKKSTSKKAK